MDYIFEEYKQERERQDKKWGPQSWPSLNQVLVNRDGGCTPQRMCEHFEIPSENRAKFLCDHAFETNEGCWPPIVVEELSEVVSAENEEKRRQELIQLGAVVTAWIQDIDKRNGRG